MVSNNDPDDGCVVLVERLQNGSWNPRNHVVVSQHTIKLSFTDLQKDQETSFGYNTLLNQIPVRCRNSIRVNSLDITRRTSFVHSEVLSVLLALTSTTYLNDYFGHVSVTLKKLSWEDLIRIINWLPMVDIRFNCVRVNLVEVSLSLIFGRRPVWRIRTILGNTFGRMTSRKFYFFFRSFI